jgi:methionyl-tRNA formyltransferase
MMRIVLITQNEVFYLPKALAYCLDHFPNHSKVVAAVVLDASPFGKRQTFLQKSINTFKIFGASFFVHYSLKYVYAKLKRYDVLRVLKEWAIPVIQLDKSINSPDSLDKIREHSPDLLISIAGNQIFKRDLIHLPRKGTLNLHTALLPKYRGLMPTFWVLKNEDKITGVSVFFVDEGIDSGPIIVKKPVEIGDMTQEQLIIATKKIGMDAIIEAVDLIESGNYKLMENNDAEKTYHSFPTRGDVKEFLRKGRRFY